MDVVVEQDVNGQPKWQCPGCLGWWPMDKDHCPFERSTWHPKQEA